MNNQEKRREDLEWLLCGCPDILSPMQAARWTKKTQSAKTHTHTLFLPYSRRRKTTAEIRYHKELREAFSVWLTKRWCHRKETLIPKDIKKLLGLAPNYDNNMALISRGYPAKPNANDLLITLFREVMEAYPEYKEYIPVVTE